MDKQTKVKAAAELLQESADTFQAEIVRANGDLVIINERGQKFVFMEVELAVKNTVREAMAKPVGKRPHPDPLLPGEGDGPLANKRISKAGSSRSKIGERSGVTRGSVIPEGRTASAPTGRKKGRPRTHWTLPGTQRNERLCEA